MKTFIDIHSHILPGVDDGSKTYEHSIGILKQMEECSVTDVFLTPHYCKRRKYITPVGKIKSVYRDFSQKIREAGININLHLGTEMEFSQDGARYIKEGRVLKLGNSNCVLVEFPPYVDFTTVFRAVVEICSLGIVPIIAHVERYPKIIKDAEAVSKLKEAGAYLQLNVRSLCYISLGMRKHLKRLIVNRNIDFLGGDVHINALEKKEIEKCSKFILKYANEDYLNALMYENAKKILLR